MGIWTILFSSAATASWSFTCYSNCYFSLGYLCILMVLRWGHVCYFLLWEWTLAIFSTLRSFHAYALGWNYTFSSPAYNIFLSFSAYGFETPLYSIIIHFCLLKERMTNADLYLVLSSWFLLAVMHIWESIKMLFLIRDKEKLLLFITGCLHAHMFFVPYTKNWRSFLNSNFNFVSGISLTLQQWSTFKKNVPAIEEAIKKLESGNI